MNVQTLASHVEARFLTGEEWGTRPVKRGYACDLLSYVMAKGDEGMAWITVQNHMNVVAVASLHDMACVILPENIDMAEEPLQKAREEGIAVLSSPLTAYELAGRMAALNIAG